MATDNKGIMVYLAPDLVDVMAQYCLDNGITRKIGTDEAAPSLGSGIAHYLKNTILNAVPSSLEIIVPTEESNNNIGLSEKEITDLIEQHSNNIGLDEARITDLIEQKLAALPPSVSHEDVDRLIGSAIADLENTIKSQGAEIDRISQLIADLAPVSASKPLPEPFLRSWGEFCTLIAVQVPPANERNKKLGDEMIDLAKSKGFDGWEYDSNKKKFLQK
jgi:hypothetical protein